MPSWYAAAVIEPAALYARRTSFWRRVGRRRGGEEGFTEPPL